MSRDINPFGLRMPPELRQKVEDAAKQSGRSLNAEIVERLEDSFLAPPPKGMRDAKERRKLELVAEYVDWCRIKDRLPEKSFHAFAEAYNLLEPFGENDDGSIDQISDIDVVDPEYLSELYKAWARERDSRFPQLFLSKNLHLFSTEALISELLRRHQPGQFEVRIGIFDKDAKHQ